MNKLIVCALLRVVQSAHDRFNSSDVLRTFCDEYRIGRVKGTRIFFDSADKAKIVEALRAEHIDPQTPPAAWDGMTRAEALALGPNEKFTATRVKRERVAIKTLPGNPLCCDGREILLPPGSHLDVTGPAIAPLLRHMSILFVENWESFDRIHATDPDRINFRPAGVNPLVLWRGDSSDTRPNHALALLRALNLPVWAFVDFDPAGLQIAASLPGLAGIIAPDSEFLTQDLHRGDADRYLGQIPAAQAVLNACPSEPVQRLWAIIRQVGRALPQERYLIAGATYA
jgi:hypothetical protein